MLKYVVGYRDERTYNSTIDKELLKWLDEKIDEKIFANRSHGFEFLIAREMEGEDEK